MRFTITSDTTVTPDYPDDGCGGTALGLLARKFVSQPMQWSAAAGRTLTVPIRIENRSSYSITLPIRIELPSGEGNRKVILPSGTAYTKIIPLNMDSTLANGAKLWLVGGTGTLPAGDTALVHNLTFQIDTPVVKGELWFVLKGEEVIATTVPIEAPDSLPEALMQDSSYLANGILKRMVSVRFDSAASLAARAAAIDSVDGVVVGGKSFAELGMEGYYYIYIEDAVTEAQLEAAIAILLRQPGVDDATKQTTGVSPGIRRPNDTTGFAADDWAITPDSSTGKNFWMEEIALPLAWGCETGSDTVSVAVIDNNFQRNNFGSNLPNSSISALTGPVWPLKHGTVVSQIIGSWADDGKGMPGVAWRTAIKPYQFRVYRDYLSGLWFTTLDDLEFQLVRAMRNGVPIVNLSLYITWKNQPVDTSAERLRIFRKRLAGAIRRSVSYGLAIPVMTVIAGNESQDSKWSLLTALQDSFPGQAIVVGGSEGRSGNSRDRWGQSNKTPGNPGSGWGDQVQIYAPAKNIYYWDSTAAGFKLDSVSGTSVAAPQVAAVAALLKSFYPSLTAAQIVSYIRDGAAVGGRVVGNSGGRYLLNAYESLRLVSKNHSDAPICGVPVKAVGNKLLIQRNTVDTLTRSDQDAWDVSVAQGGRKISATAVLSGTSSQATDVFTLSGGSWLRTTTSGVFAIQYLERDTAYLRGEYTDSTAKQKLFVRIGSNQTGRSTSELEVTASSPTGLTFADWNWVVPKVSPTGDWVLFHVEGDDTCSPPFNFFMDAFAFRMRSTTALVPVYATYCHGSFDGMLGIPAWRGDGRSFFFASILPAADGTYISRWSGVTALSIGTAITTSSYSDWRPWGVRFDPYGQSFTVVEKDFATNACRTARRDFASLSTAYDTTSECNEWMSGGPTYVAGSGDNRASLASGAPNQMGRADVSRRRFRQWVQERIEGRQSPRVVQ